MNGHHGDHDELTGSSVEQNGQASNLPEAITLSDGHDTKCCTDADVASADGDGSFHSIPKLVTFDMTDS